MGPIELPFPEGCAADACASFSTGSGPIELGPIGMTVGASSDGPAQARVGREEEERNASSSSSSSSSETEKERVRRLSSLSTEEWRARYEPDGCVDLWVVEEFNAGSRLVGGRAAQRRA